MLNNIAPTAHLESSSQSAIELLLGCHQRIRHFSGVAKRLAHAQGATTQEIVQAAQSLVRYFTVALPLHEADENLSIHPRLRRAAAEGELAGPAADAMVEQHLSIDQIVDALVPLWQVLTANPSKLDEFAGELCQLSSTLDQMFDAHLKLEEETVFPAMRRLLSEQELAEIVNEMQARRKT